MKRFIRTFLRGQKGFTLMELLIVVAILGIIAAVVALNLGGFLTVGELNAANTEVENIKTAAVAYYAENAAWPSGSITGSDSVLAPYMTGEIKGTYQFDSSTGALTGTAYGETGFTWDATKQQWKRGG